MRWTSRETYEERDEDGSVHRDQSEDRRPTVTESIGDWTGSKDADESTTLTRLKQSTLPSSRDRIS